MKQYNLSLLVMFVFYTTAQEVNILMQQLGQLSGQLNLLHQALQNIKLSTGMPPSLHNLGNTCYMNSVIQGLYAIEPLNNILQNRENYYEADSLARAYVALISAFKTGSFENQLKAVARTTDATMQSATRQCGAGAQQDSQEFLTQLFLELHDSKNDLINQYLTNLFNITLQPIYYCPTINRAYVIPPDTGNQLLVPLRNPNTGQLFPNDLAEILKAFFIPDKAVVLQPEGFEQQKCTKALYITQLPPVLIIALKRYDIDPKRAVETYRLKVNAPLQLHVATATPEIEGLDKTKIPALQETDYQLQAALVHLGGLTGGHYIAYVQHSDNNWYLCNDERITRVTEEQLLEGIQSGYVYIYKKVGVDAQLKKEQEKIAKELVS